MVKSVHTLVKNMFIMAVLSSIDFYSSHFSSDRMIHHKKTIVSVMNLLWAFWKCDQKYTYSTSNNLLNVSEAGCFWWTSTSFCSSSGWIFFTTLLDSIGEFQLRLLAAWHRLLPWARSAQTSILVWFSHSFTTSDVCSGLLFYWNDQLYPWLNLLADDF